MHSFKPDYRHLVAAAHNRQSARMPLYEHSIDVCHMERLLGRSFADLYNGDDGDLREFYSNVCAFFCAAGYDTVSWEFGLGPVMPGSGALGSHKPGVIQSRGDFDRYPWQEIADLYFNAYGRHIEALNTVLPDGMKAVGGVGNGVFECVQDVVGYESLCLLSVDDPELYGLLFERVGWLLAEVWTRFLSGYGDLLCVCRMGDDLGYKSSTLLSGGDIRRHILPRYREIVDVVHRAGKPFLLHSCGNLFEIFDDIMDTGIDAKHSNEDQIAPFPVWVERYGGRIGNFGGVDTDAVCRLSRAELADYIGGVLRRCEGGGGVAFGTGNSVPSYVPSKGYFNMLEIVRGIRGE